jgi:hypothetical protein
MASGRSGAGAITSTQMPSFCTVSTTGYAATWPNGERATSAASSRRSGTRSSTISGVPVATRSAAAAESSSIQTPRPSYPPLVALATTGQPTSAAKSTISAAVVIRRQRGTGAPSAASRSRISPLSWANSNAEEPGKTLTPSSSRARMCEPGTCS